MIGRRMHSLHQLVPSAAAQGAHGLEAEDMASLFVPNRQVNAPLSTSLKTNFSFFSLESVHGRQTPHSSAGGSKGFSPRWQQRRDDERRRIAGRQRPGLGVEPLPTVQEGRSGNRPAPAACYAARDLLNNVPPPPPPSSAHQGRRQPQRSERAPVVGEGRGRRRAAEVRGRAGGGDESPGREPRE
ncbi:hypothetical protein THAOC_09327 [Thalassiosira oceanica]|uniref:Uncharacterized protein n=1 Tax=Thalassiosira oceanica TaxID=159749 RepID=K0T7U7_THAOC|nr:hypothetical protein THAOC_09327 [Thalassiosira oceanica]|eukprot:EJK69421.1 hypothetical protein THAOC_09327 [Thalassiosira oceanica]